MHYIAYLDEFGHIGPYISRDHPRFQTSPVFGLAGLLIPADQVREFAIYFYKLKCHLLAWELEHNNPERLPPYRWEKKGAALFTVRNVVAYRSLRRATQRMLRHLGSIGGHMLYVGIVKTEASASTPASSLFRTVLVETVRLIDQHCQQDHATFAVLLDEQQAGSDWRELQVEACTNAMFTGPDKCRALIEPPLQAESHLFQTLQCADWLCGLVGRLAAHSSRPEEFADWSVFAKKTSARVSTMRCYPAADCSHWFGQAPKRQHDVNQPDRHAAQRPASARSENTAARSAYPPPLFAVGSSTHANRNEHGPASLTGLSPRQ